MFSRIPTTVLGACAFMLCLGIARGALANGDSPLGNPPKTVIAGIPFSIELGSPTSDETAFSLELIKDGNVLERIEGTLPSTVDDIVIEDSGLIAMRIAANGLSWEHRVRALPGLFTILPPVLAIIMALLFRQVIIALFAGVWLGAFFVTDYHPFRSFYYVVDHYVVQSLAGSGGADHVSIGIFTLLLGGMVGVFSRIGGTQGVVNQISRIATSPRRGQLATWLMGIAIFFDDYTNTLIVGNTMRPITDRLRISREKLSYIVDSTAAPVAVIAVITSWIGFEISLVKDAFDSLGIDRNPFTTFIASIQYSFYPILTLIFGLCVASSTRDFGPMRRAEARARISGQLLADGAMPLSSIDKDISFDEAGAAARWYNAAIPIFVVVLGTFAGLLITGRSSLVAAGVTSYSLLDIVRESNSFSALLWSSLSGATCAIVLGVVQRLAALTDIMHAFVGGVKSMMAAIIILVLAWCIGSVCNDLHTADYLVAKVSGLLSPRLLPSIIFIIAATVSFSTGTSWGTMTILTPITIPLVVSVAAAGGIVGGGFDAILLSSIAAIMAGAVFGDHCSPISDTTIMSSMASGADHVDHVRTQLPYAMTVGIVSVVLGFLPAGMGMPPLLAMLLGGVAVFGIVMLVGRPEPSRHDVEL